jgi:hypothetical protein
VHHLCGPARHARRYRLLTSHRGAPCRKGGILDGNNTLVEDPRQSRWQELLQPELQVRTPTAPHHPACRACCER